MTKHKPHFPATCLGVTRKAYIEAYPGLKNNPAYWRMFIYLLYPNGDDEFRWYLGHDTISYIVADYKVSATTFLNEFKNNVLPNFAWAEYSKGQARTITNSGLCELDYDIYQEDRIAKDRSDRVYFEDGSKWSYKKHSKIIKGLNELMIYEAAIAKHESQKIILDYHASLPTNIYTKMMEENKDRVLSVMGTIGDYAKPFYHIASEKTPRVYPVPGNINLTNIKKDIRKAVTYGCVEADLSSAHLAIIAMDWNVEELSLLLKNLKRQDMKVWQYFANELGVELTQAVKGTLKKGIYSLCYGSLIKNIINKMNIESNITKLGERFMKLDIIQIILKARRREMSKLKVVELDTYESPRTSQEIRSLLSCNAQAIEQDLISQVYIAAKDMKRCKILVYSYDGVTLLINDKRAKQQILSKLKKAVDDRAKILNVITTLEFEEVM